MAPMNHTPTSAQHPHSLPPPGYPPQPPKHHTPTSLHPIGPGTQSSPTYPHGPDSSAHYGPGYHLPPPQPSQPHQDPSYPHPIAPLPHHTVDHGYGPPYGQQSGSYSGLPPRKKPNRAAQACNVCRLKKQKCDEKHPCGSCAKDGLECQYRGSQQSKPDRVLDAVQRMLEQTMEDFQFKLDQIAGKMDGIENHLGIIPNASRPKRPKPAPIRTTGGGAIIEYDDDDDDDDDRDDAEYAFREGSPRKDLKRAQMSVPKAEDLNPPVVPPGHDQGSRGETDESEDFSISQSALIREHTTGAHHLSKWPYVADLFEGIHQDYAMNAEKDQGNLRPNGIGPAIPDDPISNLREPRSPYGDDARYQFEYPDGAWGGDLSTPKVIPDHISIDHVGGLNLQGELNLDENMIHVLKESYLKHMHILHPFIHREYLERLIRNFAHIHSPSVSGSSVPTESVVGMKRKRSNTSEDTSNGSSLQPNNPGLSSHPTTPSNIRIPRKRPEHSISNAIVLLVMALGKILDYRDPLPPIPHIPRDDFDKGMSPLTLNPQETTAPRNQGSLPLSFQPSQESLRIQTSPTPETSTVAARSSRPMPPPPPPASGLAGNSHRRPRTFSTTSLHSMPRNQDVIPGMAYYAYASTILGGIAGGHTLSHVHAYLLAGLMMGQLARVTESWHWINLACRTCLLLIKEDIDALRAPLDPAWMESRPGSRPGWLSHDIEAIKFAFWTCIQLEGDILAEFETLPHSGISAFEDKIGYPSAMGDPDKIIEEDPMTIQAKQRRDGMLMIHYSSQIYLRKTLNLVHTRVYRKETNMNDSEAALVGPNIFEWRQNLPPWLQWDDADYLTEDIHKARLRGKFYGCSYIITRPFLYRVISRFTAADISRIDPELLREPPKPLLQLPEFSTDRTVRINQVIQVAKWCLWLAIRSTTAFDGLRERWRITNIHGTLTAQFSNMLVLFAAYNSFLQPTLDKALLIRLYNRTIIQIDRMSGLSLSLKINARILRRARDIIDGNKRIKSIAITGGGPSSAGHTSATQGSLGVGLNAGSMYNGTANGSNRSLGSHGNSHGHGRGNSRGSSSNTGHSSSSVGPSPGPLPMSMSHLLTPGLTGQQPMTLTSISSMSSTDASPVDSKGRR